MHTEESQAAKIACHFEPTQTTLVLGANLKAAAKFAEEINVPNTKRVAS
jgi:hypothetical protein